MIFYVIWIAFWLLFIIKVHNSYKQQKLIMDSISTYVDHNQNLYGCKLGGNMLDSIEPLEKTLFRIFDWGYERILPDEYYQILRPYIIMTKEKK